MAKTIVGYDAKRIVRNATGLGNYCRTLVNDLAASAPPDWQLRLYAPDAGRDELRRRLVASERMQLVCPEGCRLPLQRAWWRTRAIIGDLRRDGVQLYHGLSGELPWGISRAGIPAVVTIHDLIFLRHPEYYPWLDRHFYAWKFRVACREASRIIAISDCTKRDIVSLGGVAPDRIDVVYQSCSPRFTAPLPADQAAEVCRRYRLPARFMLSVGTVEERKNLLLAVRALPLLPAELHLVAVGRPTPYARLVEREAAQLGVGARLHLLQGVTDADLHALYQTAEVFVYPSRYEGFGIPVIEAIHSGLPVVAATGSCLEEAGGPDSLYVSPDAPDALAAAVVRVLRGAAERASRVSLSRQYVRRFEGSDVAAQVLGVYRRVLAADI